MKTKLMILCLSLLLAACTPKENEEIFVKKIDHFMLTCKEPKELYGMLEHTFDLPVSWPYRNMGEFTSGGIEFGNCVLEAVDFKKAENIANIDGILGMAFEPAMKVSDIKDRLREKGFQEANIYSGHYWQNLVCNDLSTGGTVFFCEYQIPVSRPDKEPGGNLGIRYIEKVKIAYSDYTKALDLWRKLLVPHKETKEGFWEIEASPNIEIIKDDYDKFISFEVKVKSLEKARSFLSEKDLIGKDTGSSVYTDPQKTYGVLFEFTE
ncbi:MULTISPECIES: hypothetical protein [unclassified Treponema]|uniref:hypothetical protein n=1 Tax=unclassified Treponema TaxID=2638727 RepID=UPI0020A59853|nr:MULTISPECIES: hypothetical protein [unclassified Treponema]UTC67596.1 hypothetical protein E4O06_02690 [Treponema sp. OMZ 789]UTC70323.1 hypothetical protein E4O01_02680 [Treponema sp. OMZ 790]UTC73038.1 hypothetical protein E4O02_02680 [Treponema sp. OMZ 791]